MKELPIRVFSLCLLLLFSIANGLQSPSECFFNVNGHRLTSLMVTEDEVNVIVNSFGSCELTFLAVGGGGRGDNGEAAPGISSIRRFGFQVESRLSML